MQTDHQTEHITAAFRWESVRLPKGAYRVQNVERLTEVPNLDGFKNCTECGIFVDQLHCVREAYQLDGDGLWIGLVRMGPHHNEVTTLLWELALTLNLG